MAGAWRRAMAYLGLVDDEAYDEYEYYDEDAPLHEEGDRRAPADDPADERPARRRPTAVAAGAPSAVPEASGAVTVVRARRQRAAEAPRERPLEPAASPAVRPVATGLGARVHVMEPAGFNDAQEVGDRLKADQPVILNLQGVDRDLQRRLIDFSSGLAYALGGAMSKAADQVFLLTPSNVWVSDEEKERLRDRGLYRA